MRIIALVILTAATHTGCSGAHGSAEPSPALLAHTSVEAPKATLPPPAAARQQSRTTERDFDADGITDYRVFITESFDAEGRLVSVTEEQDFEADGVVDARETTNFR